MQHITRILAETVSALHELPEPVVETTRLFLLDYYAASMAGYRVNRAYNRAVEEVFFGMGGAPDAAVLFSQRRLPAMNAAFLNATYAHGADMDDGNRKAMGHVAATVMPATLALADTLPRVTERDVLLAINAGYEVYCRLAAGAQPGLVRRGFHSTGTAGVIAAAAACAKLLGLDAEGVYNAMSLAATQAAGLLIVAESGQACKPMNPARAAQGGVLSALLVQNGVRAFDHPLESEKGWFHAMCDAPDEGVVLDTLGKRFSITECYLKPYPSCRHTHCGLEAARELLPEIDAPIARAEVFIYPNAIRIAGRITHPRTDEDTKFSIHYALACMLANGAFGLADLNLSQAKPAVGEMIDRVTLIEDPAMENRDKGVRGARVRLTLENGKTLERTVLIPKGDPENPLTLAELLQKADACGEGVQTPAERKERVDRVLSFGGDAPYRTLL